jgi:hypothetical protein
VELKLQAFITSALDGCERSASHLGCFARMGGIWRQSACSEEEKTLALPGIEAQFHACPALNLVNIPTEVFLLSLHCYFAFSPEYFKNA